MKNEITWRHRHLMWTTSGTVWATWRVTPRPYGFADIAEKEKVRREHQDLFQSILGEGLLLGLSSRLNSDRVGDRMMRDVRMDKAPAHLEEVNLTLDALDDITMGSRAYYFAVPLSRLALKSQLLTQLKASYGHLRDRVGARRLTPSHSETVSALIAAEQVEKALPTVFEMRPATLAEQTWIFAHSGVRGLPVELPEPEYNPEEAAASTTFATGAAFGDPWLDEGGVSELDKHSDRLNPFRRRFLKVQSPHADEPSYQVMLALTGTPEGGWMFPGVEWLSWCDSFPVEIDWAVRFHVYSADTARTKNKHAEQGLDDQLTQIGADNSITGGHMELQRNAELLQEYHTELTSDEREVEVQPTVILTISADSAKQAMADAQIVQRAFRNQSFIFEPVLGEQEALWWSTLPGTSSLPIVRALAQLTTGRGMSTTVPLVSNDLGDADGIFLGFNRSTSRLEPLFINPYGATQSDQSGCIAITGDLGKGKSVTIKKIAGSAFDRGGILVIIDQSIPMEYATFARSLSPDSTAIVELLHPEWSIDPIRVFGTGEDGAELALSLLNALLDLDPLGDEGTLLSEALAPDTMRARKIDSLRSLRDQLAASGDPVAQALTRRINRYADHKLGKVLFDTTLPPVDLDYRAVVFCTRGLEMPSDDEMATEAQIRKLPVDRRFALHINAYLAEIGKTICFADDKTFSMLVTDEVGAMTALAVGRKVIKDFVLRGRKSAASLLVGGQTVSQLGDADVWELIPNRIVCGHESATLARQAAAWIGWDPDVEANVKAIQNLSPRDPRHPRQEVPADRRGEIIMRDAFGRVGPGRVLLPFHPARRKAVLTTPPRATSTEAA